MKLMTRTGYNAALDTLMDAVELNETTQGIFDNLRNDFAERESILSQVGSMYDDDTIESYEYVPDKYTNLQTEYQAAVNERDFAKRQYRERFWSTTPQQAVADQLEDVAKDDDSANLSIADLFSKREGDK